MRKYLALLLLCTLHFSAIAQSKKPLDHTVYDDWKSVGAEQISNNGRFVVYNINPQEGDANLVVTNLQNNRTLTIPRGTSARISENSTVLVFLIKPHYAATKDARIKKLKPEQMPKDSLGILTLANFSLTKIPMVKSFSIPEKASNVLVYQLEKPVDTAKVKVEYPGNPLVIKNLLNNTETFYQNVNEFVLNKQGTSLAFYTEGSTKDSSDLPGLYLVDLQRDGLKKISNGKGIYKQFAFSDDGTQFAFLANKNQSKAKEKPLSVYTYRLGLDSAIIIASNNTSGFPSNWLISENGSLRFNQAKTQLYFGIAPKPMVGDTTIAELDAVKLDVWHYLDDRLQTQQLRTLQADQRRNITASIGLNANIFRHLQDWEDDNLQMVSEIDTRFAVATSTKKYRLESQWAGFPIGTDVYKVDLQNGNRKLILEGVKASVQLSPDGKYAFWYENAKRQWFAMNLSSEIITNLTEKIPVNFYDEEHDEPSDPGSYGFAGWSEGDAEIFINDRYDVWEINPANGRFRNITGGIGRRLQQVMRYVRLDSEQRFVDTKNDIIFSVYDEKTKMRGFYSGNIRKPVAPSLRTLEGFTFGLPRKAKNANVFIVQKNNFTTSPDLYVSTNNLSSTRKLSDINPQQKEYNWGTVELVNWQTYKGKEGVGMLYKPENFDPNKKYPMIVYFYDVSSQGLYSYTAPAPTPSRLNITYFVSNEYLVFVPDIKYEIGYPGPSAYDFIVSGVESLGKNTWVDMANVAIQGQSWGGYQLCYIITQTNMFKAAWAGAPVANMTSAYGGIRWESGLNRQFQYEKTQSRIGVNLWENPELYIINSPLFYIPNIETPLVMMHNDADGAVPWYQGIEMYTGMRRLGKPVWMLNYNGEAHNLVERKNRKDISIRQQQFFDYLLKGAKPAVWIKDGVPAIQKGKTMGLEIAD